MKKIQTQKNRLQKIIIRIKERPVFSGKNYQISVKGLFLKEDRVVVYYYCLTKYCKYSTFREQANVSNQL